MRAEHGDGPWIGWVLGFADELHRLDRLADLDLETPAWSAAVGEVRAYYRQGDGSHCRLMLEATRLC